MPEFMPGVAAVDLHRFEVGLGNALQSRQIDDDIVAETPDGHDAEGGRGGRLVPSHCTLSMPEELRT